MQAGGITSSGVLLPNVDVKLVDVPEMGYFASSDPPQGEICVKTDDIISGYYKNPEATAEKFVDGYFRTGRLSRCGFFGKVCSLHIQCIVTCNPALILKEATSLSQEILVR